MKLLTKEQAESIIRAYEANKTPAPDEFKNFVKEHTEKPRPVRPTWASGRDISATSSHIQKVAMDLRYHDSTFSFEKTPQGFDYWNDVCLNLENMAAELKEYEDAVADTRAV